MKEIVYIGMGSSTGESEKILHEATQKIEKLGEKMVVSSFLKNPPWGGVAKNIFFNAVVKIETHFSPQELLQQLQKIENEAGRIRNHKWDDRTLDLDILFFGTQKIAEENLQIPHPFALERDFVLTPLLEIFPDFWEWHSYFSKY